MNDGLGKKAEQKIKEWLDKPESGYSFDRIKDQMTGFYGSSNICDFTCFKSPYMYYIESKATYEDRFDFTSITDTQYNGLLQKSYIQGVYGVIILLYASYKRAFVIDIRSIQELKDRDVKSINIHKLVNNKYKIPYEEIGTVENSRKHLLDYTGPLVVPINRWNESKECNEHENN